LFVFQNFAPFFFKGSSVITNISVANPAEIPSAKHNFGLRKISAAEKPATEIFRLRPNFSLNLAKNICLELATLIDVNNNKYSPVLGLPELTTPIHENRKIRYENELLKAKEPTPDV
jgi:hypothetical protein